MPIGASLDRISARKRVIYEQLLCLAVLLSLTLSDYGDSITATTVAESKKSSIVNLMLNGSIRKSIVQPVLPTLPQVHVDASMPDTSHYSLVQVKAGGHLQSAIDNASCNPTGTIITIHAGATFKGPILLPAKSCAEGQWIIVRSDAPDSNLPALETRINPSYETQLPIILASDVNRPAIQVAVEASNYRLMFLEAKLDLTAGYTSTHTSLIAIGDGRLGGSQNTIASQPKNIVVDRVLVRGSDNPPIDVFRGVDLECKYCAVINSYIDQIHARSNDSQAIIGWNSTGPWLIDNNYLSAAGENILVGGAPINISNALPSDVTIIHNYFFKPLSWRVGDPSYAGVHWTVKNLFEMKVGMRFLLQGNVLQNVWPDAQEGEAIGINTSNQSDTPWAQVSDVTFQLNEVINAAGGFGGPACSTGDNGNPNLGNQRNLFQNNLLLQIGGESGRRVLVLGDTFNNACGMSDVFFNHNTILPGDTAPSMMTVEAKVPTGIMPLRRFAFHNNIIAYDSTWGVSENCQVNSVRVPCWTTNAWWDNIVFDTVAKTCDNNSFGPHAVACPVANVDVVGFVNPSAGDYHLTPNSIGRNAGTDGKDVGADIDALDKSLAGATDR